MKKPAFIPYDDYIRFSEKEMIAKSEQFKSDMQRRRTVRNFSDRPVPKEIIENAIKAAGTAPNGANKQPWHFVVISDPEMKRKIRIAAEEEEQEFYNNRAPKDWLEVLQPFGTDEKKPFLETAPYLIAIFSQNYGVTNNGEKEKHYYVKESVGIATGILITALHLSGLATLTHTPSPMGFLNEILNRPKNEKPFLLLVAGYPGDDVEVPVIEKKSLNKISSFH